MTSISKSAFLDRGHGSQPVTETKCCDRAQAIPVAAGVWRIRYGTPEKITPIVISSEAPLLEAMGRLASVPHCPLPLESMTFRRAARGCVVELPFHVSEAVYGFGLQLKSVRQHFKKTMRVNADPVSDTGDSHAPVPFYVTTGGYGVYIDTARYASFYIGSHVRHTDIVERAIEKHAGMGVKTDDLYRRPGSTIEDRRMVVDIPVAQGIDIYIFAGPTLGQAIQRYNLFSGGGCLPPIWGLGCWYRAYTGSTHDHIRGIAGQLRANDIPCDVIGLEPGWQSTAYPNSFVWDPKRYPAPQTLLAELKMQGFHVNLWENAFVAPRSPLYEPLRELSGNELSTDGLAPDFLLAEARDVFAEHHSREFVEQGISGFKLDECDNGDFTGAWSFPEYTVFPSGADGEQMHSLYGVLYQQVMDRPFQDLGLRHLSQVRSSGALAAPLPFVLYSDLYAHDDFIRGGVTAGFSGLLWSPEVRHADSTEDLLRRIETTVFSAQALVNAWYIKNPPWFQTDCDKNNRDERMPESADVTERVRELLRLRMQLIPYLYSAFWRYKSQGIPPIRAVVVDFPEDPRTHDLQDQYLFGESMLIAPLRAGQVGRSLYLPGGSDWYCFWTNRRCEGGARIEVAGHDLKIPVFVRSGHIVPMASPVTHTLPGTIFDITAKIFGQRPAPFTLYDDDGITQDYQRGEFAEVKLSWKQGALDTCRVGQLSLKTRYRIVGYERID